MAGSLNKVTLIGNLGKDPEIRSTNDGREIASFSLATTESWKDKATGEKRDKTEWHRVVCFSEGLVRVLKNYAKKGSKLYIEGQLQTRKWTDNENQERYMTEIVLTNYNSHLLLLDSRNDQTQSGTNQYSTDNSRSNQPPAFDDSDLDDEVPF